MRVLTCPLLLALLVSCGKPSIPASAETLGDDLYSAYTSTYQPGSQSNLPVRLGYERVCVSSHWVVVNRLCYRLEDRPPFDPAEAVVVMAFDGTAVSYAYLHPKYSRVTYAGPLAPLCFEEPTVSFSGTDISFTGKAEPWQGVCEPD